MVEALLHGEAEVVLGRTAEGALATQLLQSQWPQSCHLGIMGMTSK